jgi:hypothetical protein
MVQKDKVINTILQDQLRSTRSDLLLQTIKATPEEDDEDSI